MKMTLCSFWIFVLLACSELMAQRNDARFDSLVQKGIKEIYNINYSAAEATFRQIIADYPKHPAGRFFLAMVDWWRILPDLDNESYDDIFFEKLEDVIYQCDELLEENENNVDALFFKGGAIGFRGRLRAIRESWIKAADDGREALPIVQRASKLDPTNKDVALGFGIYNYYAAVIPEQYPLIKPLMIFFPSGDKQRGIEQLHDAAIFGRYTRYEAVYFLMTLYYQFENNADKADEYATRLVNDFPNNPTFERWKGRINARRGFHEEYFRIFSSVHNKYKLGYPGYGEKADREANYYIGLYYKNIQKADSSIYHFTICEQKSVELDKNTESGFLINTRLYLGMMYDALGKRDEAVKYYNKILAMRNYGNSHDFAKEYLSKPYKF